MTTDEQVDSLSLKWGTLKSWDIHSETGKALLKRYDEIGSSMSAMAQRDTPEQKEIICQLIDGCAGDIYLDWDGVYVSKEKAKEYVRNYGKKIMSDAQSNEQQGMRSEQKRKWLSALRSGKLAQGNGQLGSVSGGLCCLGVFCLVNRIPFNSEHGGQSKGPAGLFAALTYDQRAQLWHRNDGMSGFPRHSFAQLADYIEISIPCVDDIGAGFAEFCRATLTALKDVTP